MINKTLNNGLVIYMKDKHYYNKQNGNGYKNKRNY